MSKNTRWIIIILVVAVILYFVSKFMTKPKSNGSQNETWETYYPENAGGITPRGIVSGQCIKPTFKDMDLSGRECAGTIINENKTLKLGDQSCEVLLLQQRLNAMQSDHYILKPTGQFCCQTKFKLNLLMNASEISLNMFSPDEQIGFNELEGGKKMTPYSYMDLNTKIK